MVSCNQWCEALNGRKRLGFPRKCELRVDPFVAVFAAVIVLCVPGLVFGDSSAKLPLDVAIVTAISGVPVLPDTELSHGTGGQTISAQLARNELEAASFVIRSEEDIDSLQIVASKLRGASGTLSTSAMDIKLVKAWYQGDEAWTGRYNKKKRRVLVPELMLNDDSLVAVDIQNKRNYLRVRDDGVTRYVDISTDGNETGARIIPVSEFDVRDADDLRPFLLPRAFSKQIWITFRASGAAPGRYHGSITLRDDRDRSIEIPVDLDVLQFRLCDPEIEYSMYYRGKLSEKGATISSEFKSRAQLRAELADMREHGIANPNVYQPVAPVKLLGEYLRLRREAGFSNETIYYHGIRTGKKATGPYSYDEVIKRYEQIEPTLREHGVTQTYVYGIDEARGELLRSQYELWRKLRRAGLKIYVSGRSEALALVGEQLDLLIHRRTLDPELALGFHRLGHRIFSYNNPQIGAENPAIYRKNYGLDIWRAGYDGVMNYAYMTSFQSSWNDFDHKIFRDHNFVYPTSDGVISTIAWEGFREGVDDVRYVTTIKHVLASRGLSAELAVSARRLLDEVKGGKRDPGRDRHDMRNFLNQVGAGCGEGPAGD